MKSLISQNKIRDFFSVLIGTGLLCSQAIYNGFPIVYPDSGTYISACFENFLPRDRPLAYSFFLRHTSLAETLWLPVIFQSFILSGLIFLLFRHLGKTKQVYFFHLASIAFLSLCTGIAVISGQLIADIFTPVLTLSALLLVLVPELSRTIKILLFILLVFSIATHLSHFPLTAGLAFFAIVIGFFMRKKTNSPYRFLRAILPGIALLLSILFTVSLNYSVAGKTQFSPPGQHIFMINRLIECNILSDYLDKNCAAKKYSLCGYGSLRNTDFIWGKESPLNQKYGWEKDGWDKAKPEYDSIISDVFSNTTYVKQFILADLKDGTKQLYTFQTGISGPALEGSAPYGSIAWHFPESLDSYKNSRQNQKGLDYSLMNFIQPVIIGISVLFLLLILFLPKLRNILSPQMKGAFWWLLMAILINAFTVVTFAMVDKRFQSRMIWLFPLLLLVWLSNEPVRAGIRAVFLPKQK